jgi:uncharacterized damage-inducible protein DinB
MKKYFKEFFEFNKSVNLKILESIKQLPDKDEAVKLFSHLITSHNKWMVRFTNRNEDSKHTWFEQPFDLDELESKWIEVVDMWLAYVENNDEASFDEGFHFNRPGDGKEMYVKIRDVILQINYHSIYHRAQIARIIREQELTPPSTDYIMTVIKEA